MSSTVFLVGGLSASLRCRGVTPRTIILRLSTASLLRSNRNRPRKSGDRGPEKNYQKKLAKKANKNGSPGNSIGDQLSRDVEPMDTLMKGLKSIEGKLPQPQETSLASGVNDISKSSAMGNDADEIIDVVFDMLDRRNRDKAWLMKKQQAEVETDSGQAIKGSPQLKRPINLMKPDTGVRLGIFNLLLPDIEVMSPGTPNLTELSKQKQLEEIHLLQTTSYFQDLMEGRGVPYPRQFPINNENYEHGEAEVSFKDHVLLDHLINDFPTRGPVRHFMELVVTGLSMNPDYTAKEKQDIVDWYRDYFGQFTPGELQALPINSLPSLEPVMK